MRHAHPPANPYEHMAALAAAGRRFAVATLVRTMGSTPQVIGAKLIVSEDDAARPFGTLGGGCVEADAILAAREVLTTGQSSLRAYHLTEDLAWNTGLVCGGTMWILAESSEQALAGLPDTLLAAREAASGGAPMVFATLLERTGQALRFRSRAVVSSTGRIEGTLGEARWDAAAVTHGLAQIRHATARVHALDPEHDLLLEPVTCRPRVVVAGGGHVAKALARQAGLLEFAVTVLEDRPEFAHRERFDGAEVICADVPEAIATMDFGWNTYLVVATRGHKLDADCVRAAVRTQARYIGVLGSRRKTVLLREMLEAEQVSPERIAAIHAPVGLDLGGRTPAEIALAVFAEITQERYAGSGRPLRDR